MSSVTKVTKNSKLSGLFSRIFVSLDPDVFSAKFVYFFFCVVVPVGLYALLFSFTETYHPMYQDNMVLTYVVLFFSPKVQILFAPILGFGILGVLAALKMGKRALLKRWVRLGIGMATVWCFVLEVIHASVLKLLMSEGQVTFFAQQIFTTVYLGGILIGMCLLTAFSLLFHWYGKKFGSRQLMFLLAALGVLFFISLRYTEPVLSESSLYFETILGTVFIILLGIPSNTMLLGYALCQHAKDQQPWTRKELTEIISIVCVFFAVAAYKVFTLYAQLPESYKSL
jgi:hypothetical protein